MLHLFEYFIFSLSIKSSHLLLYPGNNLSSENFLKPCRSENENSTEVNSRVFDESKWVACLLVSLLFSSFIHTHCVYEIVYLNGWMRLCACVPCACAWYTLFRVHFHAIGCIFCTIRSDWVSVYCKMLMYWWHFVGLKSIYQPHESQVNVYKNVQLYICSVCRLLIRIPLLTPFPMHTDERFRCMYRVRSSDDANKNIYSYRIILQIINQLIFGGTWLGSCDIYTWVTIFALWFHTIEVLSYFCLSSEMIRKK